LLEVVVRMAGRRLGEVQPDGATREDIALEVLAKFYQAVHHGKVRKDRLSGVMGWLRRATKNQIGEKFRRESARCATASLESGVFDVSETSACRDDSNLETGTARSEELRDRLINEVCRLRPSHRSVILYIDYMGVGALTIASLFHMTPDGVRMLHRRAIACLAKRMRGCGFSVN